MTRVGAAVLGAVLLLAAPAAATTYVLPADETLVEQASVVAQASVAAVEPSPINGPPSTDYFVQIERVLKGYVAGGTVVVRVPGGIGPDGVGLKISGAPVFREGERLLLFLAPRSDGTYGVLHLMLGAFHERQSGGHRVAVRALSEASELAPAAGEEAEGAEPLRDFHGFAEWIGEAAAGRPAEPSYFLAGFAGAERFDEPPLLRDACTQLAFRWSDFDRGEGVSWHLRAGPARGTGERRAFDRARRSWERDAGVGLRLRRSPRSGSAAGMGAHDGLNTVLFGDPNDLVSGAFGCRTGGLVSVTGIWFDNGRGQACERTSPGRKLSYGGRRYLEILEADTVVNDGASCLFAGGAELPSRLLAHELGHSLGLAHGGDATSLMWAELAPGAPAGPSPAERRALARIYRDPSDDDRPPR
ncbi:MAG: hypothetical protein R3325_12655 [Thermoanaerobaculia bacterium]|nr:hypothetical protein [Thermoanaerobaculia bacterium]